MKARRKKTNRREPLLRKIAIMSMKKSLMKIRIMKKMMIFGMRWMIHSTKDLATLRMINRKYRVPITRGSRLSKVV
jgi:hypothetical protein